MCCTCQEDLRAKQSTSPSWKLGFLTCGRLGFVPQKCMLYSRSKFLPPVCRRYANIAFSRKFLRNRRKKRKKKEKKAKKEKKQKKAKKSKKCKKKKKSKKKQKRKKKKKIKKARKKEKSQEKGKGKNKKKPKKKRRFNFRKSGSFRYFPQKIFFIDFEAQLFRLLKHRNIQLGFFPTWINLSVGLFIEKKISKSLWTLPDKPIRVSGSQQADFKKEQKMKFKNKNPCSFENSLLAC